MFANLCQLLQQDKILDEQTNDYLSKIVEQNKEIISLLKDMQERIDNLNLK